MNTTPTPAQQIETLWLEMYAEWERGESCSPSADDLAQTAIAFLDAAPADQGEALASEVYDLLCGGTPLIDIAGYVVMAVGS